MKKFLLLVFLSMVIITLNAQDNDDNAKKWSAGRPDGHGPISVMGDHMHGKGEWMFSYRYMHMNMENLKQGSDNVSFSDALIDYMVTPTEMPMNMNMLGIMYAPKDNLTLMAMLNYQSLKMDHVTRMGVTFVTEANGFGDIQLAGLYQFFNKNEKTMHAQVGFSIPTGSVNESDITPASTPNETVLPYPMQIGSGTVDSNLALTYLGEGVINSYGFQLRGIFRFGKNDRDFRYGNRYSLNNWFAAKVADWLSFSARVEGLIVGEIEGADPNLNPIMVITADTANSGGTIIDGGLGFNIYISKGNLKNLRFGAELASPLLEYFRGIQLKTMKVLTLGTQYSF